MSEPIGESGTPATPAQPQPVAAQPPARKGTSTVVLAVLAAVFLLAAGAMSVLYVLDTRAADKTVAGQKAQIASLNDEVSKTKADLDKANKDLSAAKADAEKGAACSSAVKDFFAALRANDDAKGEAAVLKMASACEASLG